MKKKLMSLALALAMCVSLCVPAWATDEEKQALQQIEMTPDVFNEYDYIVSVRKAGNIQLQSIGVPSKDIAYIKSDAIEKELQYRASLPENVLEDQYCYGNEEVSILKAYDGGRLEDRPGMRAVTATLTAGLGKLVTGPKRMGAIYAWSWDYKPVVTFTDAAAISWIGTYANGLNNEAKVNFRESRADVHYYYSTRVQPQITYSLESENPSRGCNVKIPMETYSGGFPVWAKNGAIYAYIELQDSHGANFTTLSMVGAYGHYNVSVGLGVSFPAGCSISFSGYNTALGTSYMNFYA
ncbi:hypothetical protein [Oscillibacter sp.]|uniref:hypothetical protein n=1 Tax=Oscillibacter sp. TaxID=1945593 RepID=UPI0028AB4C1D|nr:hypothetical protein [Oscillibacter sp.]